MLTTPISTSCGDLCRLGFALHSAHPERLLGPSIEKPSASGVSVYPDRCNAACVEVLRAYQRNFPLEELDKIFREVEVIKQKEIAAREIAKKVIHCWLSIYYFLPSLGQAVYLLQISYIGGIIVIWIVNYSSCHKRWPRECITLRADYERMKYHICIACNSPSIRFTWFELC